MALVDGSEPSFIVHDVRLYAWNNVGVVCRGATPPLRDPVNNEREDVLPVLRRVDLANRYLTWQPHPNLDPGDAIRRPLYLHPRQVQGGALEDVLEAVGVDLADGLTAMPPEPGHVHELRVRVEDRSQRVCVPVVPCLKPGFPNTPLSRLGIVYGAIYLAPLAMRL